MRSSATVVPIFCCRARWRRRRLASGDDICCRVSEVLILECVRDWACVTVVLLAHHSAHGRPLIGIVKSWALSSHGHRQVTLEYRQRASGALGDVSRPAGETRPSRSTKPSRRRRRNSAVAAALQLRQTVVEIAHGLMDALLVLDQRKAHESFTAGPEPRAG